MRFEITEMDRVRLALRQSTQNLLARPHISVPCGVGETRGEDAGEPIDVLRLQRMHPRVLDADHRIRTSRLVKHWTNCQCWRRDYREHNRCPCAFVPGSH